MLGKNKRSRMLKGKSFSWCKKFTIKNNPSWANYSSIKLTEAAADLKIKKLIWIV